jgi:hypothetical protein
LGLLIENGSLGLPFFVFATGRAIGGWQSIAVIGRLRRDKN